MCPISSCPVSRSGTLYCWWPALRWMPAATCQRSGCSGGWAVKSSPSFSSLRSGCPCSLSLPSLLTGRLRVQFSSCYWHMLSLKWPIQCSLLLQTSSCLPRCEDSHNMYIVNVVLYQWKVNIELCFDGGSIAQDSVLLFKAAHTKREIHFCQFLFLMFLTTFACMRFKSLAVRAWLV